MRVGDDRNLAYRLAVPLPSVTLVVVERGNGPAPTAPTGVAGVRQPGLTERENVLLTWRPGRAEGVQLFDVLFGPSERGPFARVNPAPLLSAAYLHARPPGAGAYVIEASRLDGGVSRSAPFAL